MINPQVGSTYLCEIKNAWSGIVVIALLICVDEDDVNWCLEDDNSELDERNWDVISWTLEEGYHVIK